jgi:PAS domain S-box-containing protein
MLILPFINFLSALVYMFLAVFIFLKNPGSKLNRLCSVIFMAFVLWCLGKTITHNPHIPMEVAVYPMKFVIVGAWTFSGFILWFTLLFIEKEKILDQKWPYLLLFGIPIASILSQWVDGNVITYVQRPFGWGIAWQKTFLARALVINIFITIVLSIALMLHFSAKSANPIKKKQARIIGISLFAGFLFGYGTNIIVPELTEIPFPDLAHNMALVWAIGLVYAMVKYNFLVISPAIAAENIISTMSDALFLTDPEGRIVTVNRATRNLLGYDNQELEKMDLSAIFSPNCVLDSSESTVLGYESFQNQEFELEDKNGECIPVSFSNSPLLGVDESLLGFVCIARDITEQKAAEDAVKKAYRELKETQTQLVQSAKLASIGELAAGIAHELNQPLTVIRGNVQLVQRNLKGSGLEFRGLQELFESVERNTTRMMRIINHLRTFSRQSETDFQEVAVNDIIKECFLMIGEQLRLHNIEVEMNLSDSLPKIEGDPNQLEQVFLNLITNAKDAIEDRRDSVGMHEGSFIGDRIEIETSESAKFSNTIEIQIKDTGKGIDPRNRERIFDPFFTTKDVGNGTGLGLSISYGIVTKHKGEIDIVETDADGTKIRVLLPAFLQA